MSEAITFWYKNYRGETGYRNAVPISLRFGSSDWHKGAQWFLVAFDTEKNAEREFAMNDISAVVGLPTIPFKGASVTNGEH
jgi:hypothetical protein